MHRVYSFHVLQGETFYKSNVKVSQRVTLKCAKREDEEGVGGSGLAC